MKVCVATIARNENHYLREWADYCSRLGFDRIVIYDNNDSDGERPQDVLTGVKCPDVRVIDVRKSEAMKFWDFHNLQVKCMQEAFDTACRDKFDWVFICDVDEYLQGVSNVKEWLSRPRFRKAEGICVRWKVYDDNDLLDVVDGDYSVVKRFTRPAPDKIYHNALKKMFVRCKPGTKVHEHGADLRKNCVDVCGKAYFGDNIKFKKYPDPKLETVRLAHYKCMTAGEYIRKKMMTYPPGPEWYNNARTFFLVNRSTPEKRAMFEKLNKQEPKQ